MCSKNYTHDTLILFLPREKRTLESYNISFIPNLIGIRNICQQVHKQEGSREFPTLGSGTKYREGDDNKQDS